MIEIKKTERRLSTCDNCGVAWGKEIYELRCSLNGGRWTTIELCEDCLREMKKEIAKIIP